MIRNTRYVILSLLLISALGTLWFARAPIEAKLTSLYSLYSGSNASATGLVGHWTLDAGDISGTSAIDRSGNGNTGTLTLGPTQATGQIGGALTFDGSDDYVSVPDSN